ncbi:MAG TPA: TonB-dependent receptor, partial [Lysobacter sp.]|nr:TonB-dependent receptor [Lysobacter sp.]
MQLRKKILSMSIVAALGVVGNASAQEAAPAAPADQAAAQQAAPAAQAGQEATDLDTVVVKGIRGAIGASLDTKRNSDTRTEVVTSEDIGKMPDKNVADSLARVPGVTISAASANEGAFDENDRVSMRGTSPSFTQTTIDGHSIGTGDWFVLNQSGTVGRSVSYSLLPAELVDKVVVHKSSEAKLVEGGATGTVDIVTRNPLNFEDGFSIFGSAGMVYAELPDKWDPQISVLGNWRNTEGTFGVMMQLFSEERHLRRDGQELLGYEQIGAGTAAAQANPDLAGVFFPVLIGSALFEQERKRTGGMFSAQWKPTDGVNLEVNYFKSDLEADNYNRNYMLWGRRIINGTDGTNGQVPLPGYVVRNNTLVFAEFAPTPGVDPSNAFGIYDEISRPGAKSSTEFLSVEGAWDVSDKLRFSGQAGTSEGHGETPTQDVAEWDVGLNAGAGWALHGVGAADWHLGGTNTAAPGTPGVDYRLDWIFGYQDIDVEDSEDWAQIDGTYFTDGGVLQSVDFGVRGARHERNLPQVTAQGPNFGAPIDPFSPAAWPQGFANYPGDFGGGLGGSFPRNIWYHTPEQLAEFNAIYANRDPVSRFYYLGAYGLEERSDAAYMQLNFGGDRWTANLGMRYVQTEEEVSNFVNPVDPNAPGVITTSAFGPYTILVTKNTYKDILPSANLKWDMTDDVVLRLAATQTMTRPDFSALAGAVSLLAPASFPGTGTGSGGNPDLAPIISTNLDATVEWYYAERALFSAGVFSMDIGDYVSLATVQRTFLTEDNVTDPQNPVLVPVVYDLTVPVGTGASVSGFELAWEGPIGDYFGAFANYTWTEARVDDGTPMLGQSENTYNVGVWFENDMFNARLNYNYRSSFYSGLDRNSAFFQDDIDSLSASFGWTINDSFSLALDAMNLNNPKTKYYAENKDRP